MGQTVLAQRKKRLVNVKNTNITQHIYFEQTFDGSKYLWYLGGGRQCDQIWRNSATQVKI